MRSGLRVGAIIITLVSLACAQSQPPTSPLPSFTTDARVLSIVGKFTVRSLGVGDVGSANIALNQHIVSSNAGNDYGTKQLTVTVGAYSHAIVTDQQTDVTLTVRHALSKLRGTYSVEPQELSLIDDATGETIRMLQLDTQEQIAADIDTLTYHWTVKR